MAEWGGHRDGSGRKPMSPEAKKARADRRAALTAEVMRLASESVRRAVMSKEAKRQRRLRAGLPAAADVTSVPPPQRLSASYEDVVALMAASARHARHRSPVNPFVMPVFPPKAIPKGSGMAMDDTALMWPTEQFNAAAFGSYIEGQQFLGYAVLAMMAQRPEYRTASEIIATECTRKWIKFKTTAGTRPDGKVADREIQKQKLEKIAQLEDFLDQIQCRLRYKEIAEQDGFFGRAHLFHDFSGGKEVNFDDPELKTSIGNGRDDITRAKISKGMPLRLQTIEAQWVYPLAYNASNPLAPDWYNPQYWYVMGTQVHASRIPMFVGRPVSDMLKPAYALGGLSLSQIMKPYVDIWLQTRESVASLIHSFSVMVLKTNMANMLLPGGAEAMAMRAALFNTMRDNQGLFVIDETTEDFANVSATLAGLHELQAQSQEHMFCCRAGTLVETDRGQVPIEKVTLADRVMTRGGLAPVRWSGQTGTASELVEIRTDDSVLEVTGWHPIWSETTREFVNAENVDHSHRLLRSTNWGSTDHRSCGEDAGGGRPMPGIIGIKRLAAFFIAKSMKLTSGLSLRVSTFITSMMTRSTTALPTLSFSLAPIITGGTSLPTVASTSTASVQKLNSAWSAAMRSDRSCRRGGSTAPQPAKARSGAPIEIASVRAIEGLTEPVYNIEVAEGFLPEFYANGILVHNSVARIPAVKFAGIQPAGLNASSEGEIRILYDTIGAYQQVFYRPNLTRTIDFAQMVLWGEVDNDIVFEFLPLWEQTEKEKADARKSDADTASIYIGDGVIGPEEERERLASDADSIYQGIDPDDVPEPPPEEEGGDPFGGEGGEENDDGQQPEPQSMTLEKAKE